MSKSEIDTALGAISTADFSRVTLEFLPACADQDMVCALTDFFDSYLRKTGSKKHPILGDALKCTSVRQEDIPLLPLLHLKQLGVLLALARSRAEGLYGLYAKRLVRHGYYNEDLFELYIGCVLADHDATVEFCDFESPEDGIPDFRKEFPDGESVWIEAYRRSEKTRSKEFWVEEPHSADDYQRIVMEFVRTTCKKIREKRKRLIPPTDVFVTAVRVTDRFLAGHVDFQALVDDLPSLSSLLVYRGGACLNADSTATDESKIYFRRSSAYSPQAHDFLTSAFPTPCK